MIRFDKRSFRRLLALLVSLFLLTGNLALADEPVVLDVPAEELLTATPAEGETVSAPEEPEESDPEEETEEAPVPEEEPDEESVPEQLPEKEEPAEDSEKESGDDKEENPADESEKEEQEEPAEDPVEETEDLGEQEEQIPEVDPEETEVPEEITDSEADPEAESAPESVPEVPEIPETPESPADLPLQNAAPETTEENTLAAPAESAQPETLPESTDTEESLSDDSSEDLLQRGGELPSYYNVYEMGLLPALRNQGTEGACWAFAAIGAIEADLIHDNLATTDVDLSELYLAYFSAHDYEPTKGDNGDSTRYVGSNYLDNGGTDIMAIRILSNMIGPVDESDAPYSEGTSFVPDPDTQAAYQVVGAYLIDSSDRDAVKTAIMEHGAVTTGIYVSGNSYYDATTNTFYNNSIDNANHAVMIVGWDDNIIGGAWLVRNSWSEQDAAYGKNGYFWVSYKDKGINHLGTFTAYDAEAVEYDSCYAHDQTVYPDYVYYVKGQTQLTVSQVFTMEAVEEIAAVGFETDTANVTAVITVATDNRTETRTEQVAEKGFHLVDLGTETPFLAGIGEFVTLTIQYTGSETISVPYEEPERDNAGGIWYNPKGSGFLVDDEVFVSGDARMKLYTKNTDETPPASQVVHVKSVSLSASSLTIDRGSTGKLTATVSPADAEDPTYRWFSMDENVVSVDDAGNLRGLKNGTAAVYVRTNDGGLIASCTVTVTNPPVPVVFHPTSVTLSASSLTIDEGSTASLTATVSPANAADRSVSWSSSNTAVAMVDASGKVKGLHDGTAVITVKTNDGGLTATCTVTVQTKDPVEAFVYRMYRICLLREPDEAGFRNWVNLLKKGTKTGAEVAYGFYNSPEMVNRNLSNEEYVTRAYQGIMGRNPDAGGLSNWVGYLDDGLSYGYIISGFTGSKEFTNLCERYKIVRGTYTSPLARDQKPGITAYVSRLYRKALGRKFDPKGLNNWVEIILKNPTKEKMVEVATSGFLHSKEFLGKNLSNMDYVKVMYRTFLNREYDNNGLNNWVGKMSRGMGRDDVASNFAGSQEFIKMLQRWLK